MVVRFISQQLDLSPQESAVFQAFALTTLHDGGNPRFLHALPNLRQRNCCCEEQKASKHGAKHVRKHPFLRSIRASRRR